MVIHCAAQFTHIFYLARRSAGNMDDESRRVRSRSEIPTIDSCSRKWTDPPEPPFGEDRFDPDTSERDGSYAQGKSRMYANVDM